MRQGPVSKGAVLICLAAVALSAGCGKWGTHSRKAVEQAIRDHLSQNRSLLSNSFETEIESVSFKGDTADARVKFQSKQSAQLFVEVNYGLRLENGRWEVVSSAPLSAQGGDSHGSAKDSEAVPSGAEPGSPQLQPSH